jgi:hypothetical protein
MSDIKTPAAILTDLLTQNKQQFETIINEFKYLTNNYKNINSKISIIEDTIKQFTSEPGLNEYKDDIIPDRLQKVVFNKLTFDEAKQLYSKEFDFIKYIFNKYKFTVEEQNIISCSTTYKRTPLYNYWLVNIDSTEEINKLQTFLLEYFNLKLNQGDTRLQKYLCEYKHNCEYIFRCSHEILDKLVVPLSIYSLYNIDTEHGLDYASDINKHHIIKKNGNYYNITFPFDIFSNYDEFYQFNKAVLELLSDKAHNNPVITEEESKKSYNNKHSPCIKITKSSFTKYYVPKVKPSKEVLIKLLTNN